VGAAVSLPSLWVLASDYEAASSVVGASGVTSAHREALRQAVQELEREWVDYQHWYCQHGYLIGFGCPDCDGDEDDA
jgi:hypothetical protein